VQRLDARAAPGAHWDTPDRMEDPDLPHSPQSSTPAVAGRALRITGASKHFGGVKALDAVDLVVEPGEAVAVIGPNGAGKSTLLKLVSGVYRPDGGQILLDGKSLDRLAPHRIARLGVALAHQVPRPFSGLSVRDNVRIGAMAARPRLGDDELEEVLALCKLDTKASRTADSLRVLDLKRLEVARALATRPSILMLDEVAAGLVGRELDEAIDLISQIHARGVTVLLVEHIERVVRELVDRVLVLNWGRPIAEGTPAEIAANPEVRSVYLGDVEKTASVRERPSDIEAGQDALVLKGVSAGYGDMLALRDFSLSMKHGEIVTVLGANGAGKSTLCATILGAVRAREGTIYAIGKEITNRPVHERARLGLAYCQEGRRIFADLTVAENLALGAPLSLKKAEVVNRMKRVQDIFPVLAERAGQRAGTMSGGQQQMLAVGRALMAEPTVLICDEISLGLAPVAIDALYEALVAINAQGVAVLLVEQNVQRALSISDQAIVLSRGRISYSGSPAGLLTDAALEVAYFGTPEDAPDAHLNHIKGESS